MNEKDSSCRTLHVVSGLFYGGGQRVVLDLLGSLAEAGDIDARLCMLGAESDSPGSGWVQGRSPECRRRRSLRQWVGGVATAHCIEQQSRVLDGSRHRPGS